ncbi:MAG: mechanosensitive ion channel family protein [Mycobacteriales bacterium]
MTPLALRLTHRETADLVTPLRLLLVVVVAVAVRLLAGRAINRVVRETADGRVSRHITALGNRVPSFIDPSPHALERRRARAQTVGSVLRSALDAVLFTVVVVTVIGELGVNLAPLLASAGIVGVAIGFGSQNLVRDVLSGILLILEDQYGVGDTVDLGPAVGTVESFGLRSTRIRDVHGTLWIVRNGEILRVGNYSQAWSRSLIDVLFPLGTDLASAREVMQRTADEVWQDPAYTGMFLEQPTVWGVDQVSPQGAIIRLAVRRRNGQDAIDRDLRERLVTAFQSAGIPITATPVPVTLVGPDAHPAEPPA